MDPQVSEAKFARAAKALTDEASAFAAAHGWEVVEARYPHLRVVLTHPKSGRRVGFDFDFSAWDALPPSLGLFEPATGAALPWERWPQGGWSAGHPHPSTGRSFLCLPGIREYHTHPSHLTDAWDALRGRDSYGVLYIVQRVQQRFEVTNG